MTTAKVILVGDKEAHKTNSWLAMTNDPVEAGKLMEELEGATQMKTITVRAPK